MKEHDDGYAAVVERHTLMG